MRPDLFGNAAVGVALLVFGGKSVAVKVKKLGAIETDTFRPVGGNALNVLRQLNVGGKNDVASIPRGGLRLAQLGQLLSDPDPPGFDLAISCQRFAARIDDYETVYPVQQNGLASFES